MIQLEADYTKLDLPANERQMLDYVAKLTIEPWNMVEQDVIAMREVGWSDQAILDINQVAGYYAYVNRLADGLGVQLESYVTQPKE